MAKVTLITILNKRLSFKIPEITESIEQIVGVGEVGFLKDVYTSSGMHILQINKTKFGEIAEWIKNSSFRG